MHFLIVKSFILNVFFSHWLKYSVDIYLNKKTTDFILIYEIFLNFLNLVYICKLLIFKNYNYFNAISNFLTLYCKIMRICFVENFDLVKNIYFKSMKLGILRLYERSINYILWIVLFMNLNGLRTSKTLKMVHLVQMIKKSENNLSKNNLENNIEF